MVDPETENHLRRIQIQKSLIQQVKSIYIIESKTHTSSQLALPVSHHYRFLLFGILLLSIIILGQSCTTKRRLIRQPLREEGESYLLERLAESEVKFDWLSARCNIVVVDDKKSKTEFNGQIRIQNDSVIWISLSPALGIEVARLMITSDSIKFINRLNKSYFIGDYDFISAIFQTTIDFDILQSLILGNDLHSYENNTFRVSIDAMEYKLQNTHRLKKRKYLKKDDTPNILVQSIWLNPDNYKITKVHLKEYGEDLKRLQTEYGNFKPIESQLFPTSLKIDLQSNKKLAIQIDYSRIEVGVKQDFPFKIPGNYSKMK
jgi:hypothetical protein